MILTTVSTDRLGRRPLTVYPYAVTVVSVLCLGIIGCVDYTKQATSALLVSCTEDRFMIQRLTIALAGVLCVPGDFFHHWRICNRLCLRRRDPSTTASRADCSLVPCLVESGRHYVQLRK
jgi:hypothetical protein